MYNKYPFARFFYTANDGGSGTDGGSTQPVNNAPGPTALDETKPGADPPADPPKEKKYTDDDMSGIAKKEAEKEKKKLLQKLGVTDEKDLQGIIDTLTAAKKAQVENETPDQTVVRLSTELQTAQQTIAALTQKITAFENTEFLKGLNVFDDVDIPAQCTHIARLAADNGESFEEAAKTYIKDRPKKPEKVPATATFGGTGKTPLAPTDREALQVEWNAAKKSKDWANMARLTRLAGQKGIQLKE